MVRFLNRNWTRNSLLKSWIVFLITIFHWPKFTKTGCKQIASDKNIYFCGSYWRKKKHKQVEGMLFHLFDSTQSSPTPPPKKSPITTTTKKHPWCFYLIKQKSNNRYLFQSTSNLNGPKTQSHDQQSGSWQIDINLVTLFYPLNFFNCSYEIYVNYWKESQHLAPWMLKIIKIPMNCNQEFTV